MRELTSILHAARKALSDDKGWVWLVTVGRAASAGGGFFRLCSSTRALKAGGGDGLWYQGLGPNVMTITPPAETAEGSAGELTITIPTVGPEAIIELERRSILGQPLTIQAAHQSDLVNLPAGLRWTLTVVKATAAEKGVKLVAGHPPTFVRIPRRVFDAKVAPVFATQSGGAV